MENIVGSVGRVGTGELNAEECGDRRCSGDRILDSIVLPRGTIFWRENVSIPRGRRNLQDQEKWREGEFYQLTIDTAHRTSTQPSEHHLPC
jgi:hypothetical protein